MEISMKARSYNPGRHMQQRNASGLKARAYACAAPRRLVLLTVALAAWGCCTVPAGRFKALAGSAAQLSQVNQQSYDQSVKVERAWVVITQKSGRLTKNSFDLEFAFSPQPHKRSLGNKGVGTRIEANGVVLTVIANYLNTLSSFANNDFHSGLDKNATKLAGSVRSFNSLSEPWAKGAARSAGVLATAIDGLGHAYIERERIAALRRVMNNAQGALQQLTDFVVVNDTAVLKTLQQMQQYYIEDANLLRPRAPGAQRLAFDAYIAGVIGQFNDAQKTLAGLNKTVANLPQAHRGACGFYV